MSLFLPALLVATLAGFSQPLFPIQILWLELFIDLSTSVAFELEGPEPDLMRRKPRRRGLPLLTNPLLGRIAVLVRGRTVPRRHEQDPPPRQRRLDRHELRAEDRDSLARAPCALGARAATFGLWREQGRAD